MLLTIQNLPYTVTFNDIKSLIYSKCGIAEVILDNLIPHENRTKKVTVGLSGEEDAAIFMKNIDGAVMKGHQLRVVSKPKISTLSQPSVPDTIQPLMPPASAYTQGQNFRPPLQNVPTMVPPPMNFGTPNVFYPNQNAFYMMNQSTYPSTSSLPNIGYQTVPYANAGNQGYAQNPWSDNTWNQQQQSEGSQKSPPKKEQEANWDKSGSKPRNDNLSWDNSQSQWDNSNAKWGNSNSKWEASNSQRGQNNQSQWENTPAPERDNRRESRWNNSGNDSNWNSHNDPRPSTNRDSNWQNSRESNRDSNWQNSRDSNRNSNWHNSRDSNRDSNWQNNRESSRDNTYRSNQRAGSSRERDYPNRTYNRNYSPRPSDNIYGDHVRYPSQDKDPRDNEHERNRFNSPPRQRSPNDRNRPVKRERNTGSGHVPGGPSAGNKGNDPSNKRAIQLGRMWRGQFIATKARNILDDPRFEYEAPHPGKLLSTLTSNIKRRVRINFEDDYSMPMNQIEKKYNKIYGFHGDWVVLRDSLQKVGGRMLSKVDAGGEQNHPSKTIKKNKKAHEQDTDDAMQEDLQYGGQPQASSSMTGNVQQGPSQPRRPQFGGPRAELGSQSTNTQQGGSQQRGPRFGGPNQTAKFGNRNMGNASNQANNPMGTPLALIPGRIPQYPKGDKKLHKQHKKDSVDILASDLSSPIFSCLEPPVKIAIEKEVNLMCTMIDKFCDNPGKDTIPPDFCQILKGEVSTEMKRVFKVMLARRIVPILPTMLRVYASPPIKRGPLENFLTSFNVSALKKSKQNPYYIVECNSIEDHDKLCMMSQVRIAESIVNFKPLHLVNPRKIPRNGARPVFLLPDENAAQNTEKVNIKKDVPKNEVVDDHNNEYGVQEYPGDDDIDNNTAEAGEKQDLCQEMKNIYDQINKTEAIDIEQYQTHEDEEFKSAVGQTNEEAFQAFQSVQVTNSEDFTVDVDLDNIMSKLHEETNVNISGQGEGMDENNANESMGNQPDEENIDMVDVNDEDLEDW